MSFTNEDIKNLDRRAAVPAATRRLLTRAVGLELLAPADDAEYVTKTQHPSIPLQRGESSAGYDFEAGYDNCHVVLVLEDVNYPVAGYPEAYPGCSEESEVRFNGRPD